MDFLKELLKFLASRKKWWLIPVVLLLLVLGMFIFITETSVLAPFIYPFI